MPGTRFSPVDSCGSRCTRSGRITIRVSPVVATSPRAACSSKSPSVTRQRPSLSPWAVASIRLDTPRKSATKVVDGSS